MRIDCFDDKSVDVQREWQYFSSVFYTQNILNGKWKLPIILQLEDGPQRFSYIKQRLQHVANSALVRQLQELIQDEILSKQVYPEVPPRVEYQLTATGEDLLRVVQSMREFGEKHNHILQGDETAIK